MRPVLIFIVECGITRFLCTYAHYAHILHSGIILIHRLLLCQILFLSHPPPIAELARGEKSDTQLLTLSLTQSLTQSLSLVDLPGTEAFASDLQTKLKIVVPTRAMTLQVRCSTNTTAASN